MQRVFRLRTTTIIIIVLIVFIFIFFKRLQSDWRACAQDINIILFRGTTKTEKTRVTDPGKKGEGYYNNYRNPTYRCSLVNTKLADD